MKLNVQIDRLVLDGFNLQRNQRSLVQAAFESELARLLARDGLSQELSSGVALPSMNGSPIQIANDAKPNVLGQQIAQAVYSGIGQ